MPPYPQQNSHPGSYPQPETYGPGYGQQAPQQSAGYGMPHGAQPNYPVQSGYPAQPGYGAQPTYAAQPAYSGYPPYNAGPVDPYTGEPLSDKTKVVAGFLAFFLGCFGAGRFYVGHNGIGAAQLILYILGWVTVIFGVGLLLIVGVSIWAFIDAILMWTGSVRDQYGRRLS